MERGRGNCGYLGTERANFYFVPTGDAWISSDELKPSDTVSVLAGAIREIRRRGDGARLVVS